MIERPLLRGRGWRIAGWLVTLLVGASVAYALVVWLQTAGGM